MKALKSLSVLLIAVLSICLLSCGEDKDEPISIEGRWIVTKWYDGSKLVEPNRVIRWYFTDKSATCDRETLSYTLEGNKLQMGTVTYTVKFIDAYTMEWLGGYGNYYRVQLTKDF